MVRRAPELTVMAQNTKSDPHASSPSSSCTNHSTGTGTGPARDPQSRWSSSNCSSAPSDSTSLSSFSDQIETTPPTAEDFVWEPPPSDKEFLHGMASWPEKASDEFPSQDQLQSAGDMPVWDAAGKQRSFKSLFVDSGIRRQRHLVVFMRWFYCHACQAYIQSLKQSLPPSPSNRSSAPIPTTITLIGCGQPSLLSQYIERTKCPYPCYTDPTLRILKAMGCKRFGGKCMGRSRPQYAKDRSAACIALGTLADATKATYAPKGLALAPLPDPYAVPRDENKATEQRHGSRRHFSMVDTEGKTRDKSLRKRLSMDGLRGGPTMQVGGEFLFESGQLIWCHRMTNVRGHAEMKTLRRVLDMDEVDHAPGTKAGAEKQCHSPFNEGLRKIRSMRNTRQNKGSASSTPCTSQTGSSRSGTNTDKSSTYQLDSSSTYGKKRRPLSLPVRSRQETPL